MQNSTSYLADTSISGPPPYEQECDLNEYKREQAAPGLKVTSLAFGVGRRMPIAQKYVD